MAKHNEARNTRTGVAEESRDGVAPAARVVEAVESPAADSTPSMAQYLEIKAANPDCLLWYRMGDFYELFFEDAVAASAALSIVLTKRGKHRGLDIPMCGVPVHRADDYLQRLIKKGYRVAVCEQLEDPVEARKRGAKAVVKRDVVRLVTPGTITEEALLDAKSRNYLTAIFRQTPSVIGATAHGARLALASIDISTGEVEVGEVAGDEIGGELMRLSPGEVLVADAWSGDSSLMRWIDACAAAATPVPTAYFDALAGARDFKAALGVADLDGFGAFSRGELAAIGAALKYIDLTQLGRRPVLRAPIRAGASAMMVIDAATRASLEIVKSVSGDTVSTLLAAVDRTVTGAGARELQSRLSGPLAEPHAIVARLDAVGYFVERRRLTDDIRSVLRGAPDLARALPRLSFDRGSPRDLAAIRDAIAAANRASAELQKSSEALGLPAILHSVATRLSGPSEGLLGRLRQALVDDPPHLKREGGFIAGGFSADLDAARRLRDDNRSVMAALEARYVEETGIKGLKVRHNNILGFYVEVSQLHAKPLQSEPLNAMFRHRQTMSNAARFSTVELIEIEGQIASATERALNLEQELFADLAHDVAAETAALTEAAAALAELDVLAGLATLSIEQNYVRPIVDDSDVFEVLGGRHPVVQQALARAKNGAFIDNDCALGGPEPAHDQASDDAPTKARIWLVTGPNMAGKSTFLRQNALIAVMAQMGSYVPARSCRIGVIDRLFSRVGASDDLARGRSTFMVEMVETAAILNQATERSLVILDEIGRGTATFDGLSIAWATVEYLHDVTKARALFATHYHELTALSRRLDRVSNVTMDVSEWQDEIVFLHKVKSGAANRSYGIQVAKLAGLPKKVVDRAREVLAKLESADRRSRGSVPMIDDLPLFSVPRPDMQPALAPSAVDVALQALQPDEMSPKEALGKIYELKAMVDGRKPAKR
ncbi:MAG: DNA mismatch repair protein MutS [Hyphomicrobium sp.]